MWRGRDENENVHTLRCLYFILIPLQNPGSENHAKGESEAESQNNSIAEALA